MGPKPVELKCNKCKKTFRYKQSLSRHKQDMHHQKLENTLPNICEKEFRKGYLAKHVQVCKGPKDKRCKVCLKTFNKNMKRHMLIHTNETAKKQQRNKKSNFIPELTWKCLTTSTKKPTDAPAYFAPVIAQANEAIKAFCHLNKVRVF